MVFEKVKKLIVEQMGTEEDEITLETTSDDLGMDSLDLVEMVMVVEEEFDIEFLDEDAMNISTVGEMVDYIKNKM